MTTPPGLGQENDAAPGGVILPLDVLPEPARQPRIEPVASVTVADTQIYSPERQRDLVRLVVTAGLLLILGYLVVFATVQSASSNPAKWNQTKEMLQILLPALTGIIGTVIGFYFGTSATRAQQGG
jgi:hypothetical protein